MIIISDLKKIEGRVYPAGRRTQNIVGGVAPIKATNFSMGFVTLFPEGQVPWHNQEQEEVYFLLEGRAEFCLGEEKIILNSGEAAYIPPGVFHQITNIGEAEAKMIYVYGPAGDVAHWKQELDGTLPKAGIDVPPLPEGAKKQKV
ncbi:MAG TPA: cupin domain-containing protein [Victivallales bacterium]|nr:cupin domain-containing protein [Victivallales bacterium]HPO91338.1 cupin domain-containing protein [Victivallales bacterium]HRR05983.1 cupin domain-containing protein [Victivallales bacterium]HRR28369.1 cupin domain-containing protein [Victivallales bacterium]HRU00169.1 cupin domain-containing protein [Victivallales bacterium]